MEIQELWNLIDSGKLLELATVLEQIREEENERKEDNNGKCTDD